MPHVPKNQLPSMGSLTRPELMPGTREPQDKGSIPVRKPVKKSKRNQFMGQIDPKTYTGPGTHPGEVFQTLFGKGYEENDRGVMVRKREPRT